MDWIQRCTLQFLMPYRKCLGLAIYPEASSVKESFLDEECEIFPGSYPLTTIPLALSQSWRVRNRVFVQLERELF